MKSPLLAGPAVCLLCGQGPNIPAGNSKPVLSSWNQTRKEQDCFLADEAVLFLSFFSFFNSSLAWLHCVHFVCAGMHGTFFPGGSWGSLLEEPTPTCSSLLPYPPPPALPHPCVPGLPSPQPSVPTNPQRRGAEGGPDCGLRLFTGWGWGREEKSTALFIFWVWKLDKIHPFPRKPTFVGSQK